MDSIGQNPNNKKNKETAQKPDNSRFNVMFILHILQQYSDEDHPLSVIDILNRVNAVFSGKGRNVISVATVQRTMECLTTELFPKGTYNGNIKQWLGFEICTVVKSGGGWTPYNPRVHDNVKKIPKYYYLDTVFSTPELRALIEVVESDASLSEEDATELINKLRHIKPRLWDSKRYFDSSPELRDDDSMVMMNLDDINRLIDKGVCAEINYGYYNEDRELVPRKGYPRVVEPVRTMWAEGHYYLIAYHPGYKKIVHYRIDRILDIVPYDRKTQYDKSKFKPVEYRQRHPSMFSGEPQKYRMLCRLDDNNSMMNILIDTFGKGIRTLDANDKDLKKYLNTSRKECEEKGERWKNVMVDATEDWIILFALRHGEFCRVVSPESTVEEIRKRIDMTKELYG